MTVVVSNTGEARADRVLSHATAEERPGPVRRFTPNACSSRSRGGRAPSNVNEARPLLIIAICAAVQGLGGGLGWSVMPALMPAIAKDLHLGHTAGGFVFGAASLGIAL